MAPQVHTEEKVDTSIWPGQAGRIGDIEAIAGIELIVDLNGRWR
jgi:hypothetical protein